jgi:hypothetical protein
MSKYREPSEPHDVSFKELKIVEKLLKTKKLTDKQKEAIKSLVESTKDDRKDILDQRKMTRKERFSYYNERKAELNIERKGLYFTEIKKSILKKEKEGEVLQRDTSEAGSVCEENPNEFSNLEFPKHIEVFLKTSQAYPMEEEEDYDHELF